MGLQRKMAVMTVRLNLVLLAFVAVGVVFLILGVLNHGDKATRAFIIGGLWIAVGVATRAAGARYQRRRQRD